VLRGGLDLCSPSSWSSPRGGEAEGGDPLVPELARDERRLVYGALVAELVPMS
jgi:hypothetical protein